MREGTDVNLTVNSRRRLSLRPRWRVNENSEAGYLLLRISLTDLLFPGPLEIKPRELRQRRLLQAEQRMSLCQAPRDTRVSVQDLG